MEQGAQRFTDQDEDQRHARRSHYHLALHTSLGLGVSGAVISRNGTSASLGPMPINNTRNVSITPAAVIVA